MGKFLEDAKAGPALALCWPMPVSALVLTTDPNFTEQQRLKLADDPRVTPGDRVGEFLPIVTDTESVRESRDLAEQLLNIPGIHDAQLVSWAEESNDEEISHGA